MAKATIQMTPGDDLHLSLLMAPHSLNLAVGQLRQQLLGYGRAAFEAGKTGQCLHQIQEPAVCTCPSGDGSLRWPCTAHPPTAVAVPDEKAAYEMGAKGAKPTEQERLLFEAWMRGHCWASWRDRAALAGVSTPAAPENHLRAALQRAHDWMDSQADSQSKGNHATFDMLMLRQERDAARTALDAAQQTQGGE